MSFGAKFIWKSFSTQDLKIDFDLFTLQICQRLVVQQVFNLITKRLKYFKV